MSVDTRLARKVGLALIAALVLTLAVVTVAVGSAQPSAPLAPQIPNPPHWFYGNVATDKGRTLPEGTVIKAKTVTGSWTGFVTTTVDYQSRYGYLPQDYGPCATFCVPGYSSDEPGAKPGDQIAFYVLGLKADPVQAKLCDYAASGEQCLTYPLNTYPFAYFGHTELWLQLAIYYTITPTAGAGGTITPGTPQSVAYGDTPTFTIMPNTGYDIDDVKVDGVSQGPIATYTFPPVTKDHTIAATFKLKTFVITPTAGAGGTITPGTPQTVTYGSTPTFTITPNTGYDIEDVKVDGVSQGPIATYTFPPVTQNHTISATFKLKTFVITPTAGAGGTITPGTPQTVTYGSTPTFTITPNTGYDIEDVKVDGVSQGPINTYTFPAVTQNHTISATFKLKTFVITPTAGAGGTITPGTPQTVTYGSTPTFTITPNTGYDIEDVKVDGVSQGPIATYTFPAVTQNHTIAATFKKVSFRLYLPMLSR